MIHVSVPQEDGLDCVVVTVVVKRTSEDAIAWFLAHMTELMEEYESGYRS